MKTPCLQVNVVRCSWLHVAVVVLAVVVAILRLTASPTPPLVPCHVLVDMRVPARCRRSWCFCHHDAR